MRTRFTRRGAILVLVAVTLMLIAFLAAMAIDGGMLFMTRNTCQMTAESAALAAIAQLPDEDVAKTFAMEFAKKNMPTSTHGSVLTQSDAVTGHWDASSRTFTPAGTPVDAVKVTVRRSDANSNPMSLMFAKSMGLNKADVVASAVAATTGGKPWDIIILQDLTNSFEQEIGFAKLADKALLDCLRANTDGTSLVGLSSFNGCARINKALTTLGAGYGGIASAIAALNTCGLPGGPPTCTGTNIGRGFEIARNQFVSTPLSPNAIGKAIVLVSDGRPEWNTGTCGPGANSAALGIYATAQADLTWTEGISIFCIFYNEDNNPVEAAFLASLVRGQGIFLQTPIAAQLPQLLQTVCNSLGGPPRLVD